MLLITQWKHQICVHPRSVAVDHHIGKEIGVNSRRTEAIFGARVRGVAGVPGVGRVDLLHAELVFHVGGVAVDVEAGREVLVQVGHMIASV